MADERRTHLRFISISDELALFSKNEQDMERVETGGNFQLADYRCALVFDQSYSGACLVMIANQNNQCPLQPGDYLVVKVGNLNPLQAEVKWIKEIEERLWKLGLAYLDSKVF